MIRCFSFATLVASVCLSVLLGWTGNAMAQTDASVVGQWQCEYSRMPHSNQDPSGRFIRIAVDLGPSGTFMAQGSNYSPWTGEDTPIRINGQWAVDTQSRGVPYVVLNGQYPYYQGVMVPFFMIARIIDARNMVLQERDQTHETAVACRR